jgi:hypothetical protein
MRTCLYAMAICEPGRARSSRSILPALISPTPLGLTVVATSWDVFAQAPCPARHRCVRQELSTVFCGAEPR